MDVFHLLGYDVSRPYSDESTTSVAPFALVWVDSGAITGTLAATEAQDTIAVSGTVVAGGATITGDLAATEAQDTTEGYGDLGHVGALVATDSPDIIISTGYLSHVGTFAAVEAQDMFYGASAAATAEGIAVLLRRRRR